MNILLTSTGPTGNPEIKKAFISLLGKTPARAKVFMVSTATKDSRDWKYVIKTVRQLVGVGIKEKNIHIFSLDRKIQKSDLFGTDLILVCGGNTFLYLDKIRKTGLEDQIKKAVKGRVSYCGISAGSYVVCPTIEAASWKHADRNTIHLKDLRALNLVPFLVTAHFDEEVRSVVQNAAKKSSYPVIALNDCQAVIVRDGITQIIGATEPSFIKWALD